MEVELVFGNIQKQERLPWPSSVLFLISSNCRKLFLMITVLFPLRTTRPNDNPPPVDSAVLRDCAGRVLQWRGLTAAGPCRENRPPDDSQK